MRYGKLPVHNPNELLVVGDIHGEAVSLNKLLPKIHEKLSDENNHVVFTGDYCNRGNNSIKVFDLLISLKSKYPDQVFFLEGNHEQMLKNTLRGFKDWISYTQKTLDSMLYSWNLSSYNIDLINAECSDKGITDFLNSLLPYYETEECIVTHAPLNRTTLFLYGLQDYGDIDDDEFIYTDRKYLLDRCLWEIAWGNCNEEEEIKEIEKFLVCGHQWTNQSIKPRIGASRAFIDTGCGFGDYPLTMFCYPYLTYEQSRQI